MEEGSRISRREFLKWFALLSITSAGGVGCVCVPVVVYGPPPEPEYGPPPVEDPMVSQMTYLDKDGSEKELYGSADVPTSAQFTIYFSEAMAESSQSAVSLREAEGGAVGFESLWLEMSALQVTPAAELQPGAGYVLEVGEGAESIQGMALRLTELARAEFTAAES